MNQNWRKGCAALALSAILQPGFLIAQEAQSAVKELEIAPKSSDAVAKRIIRPEVEAKLTQAQKLALLQKKVKYVFVLFQENRAFDFYFGTYPGANGLFSKSAAKTAGFIQPIVNTDGSVGTISPFKIPATITTTNGAIVPLYPADTDSVDHSHAGIDNDLDVDAENVPHNDRYALNAEGLTTKNGTIVSLTTGLPPVTPAYAGRKAEGRTGHGARRLRCSPGDVELR